MSIIHYLLINTIKNSQNIHITHHTFGKMVCFCKTYVYTCHGFAVHIKYKEVHIPSHFFYSIELLINLFLRQSSSRTSKWRQSKRRKIFEGDLKALEKEITDEMHRGEVFAKNVVTEGQSSTTGI